MLDGSLSASRGRARCVLVVAALCIARFASAMRLDPSCGGETGVTPHNAQSGMSICSVFADDRGSFATFAPVCGEQKHQCLRFAVPPSAAACESEWAPANLSARRHLASTRPDIKETATVCNVCQRLGRGDNAHFVTTCEGVGSGSSAQRVTVKTGCNSACTVCSGTSYEVLTAVDTVAQTCTPLWPPQNAGLTFDPPVGVLLAAEVVPCDVLRIRSVTNRSNTTSDAHAFINCQTKPGLEEMTRSPAVSERLFTADILFGDGACTPLIASNASGAVAAWVKLSCAAQGTTLAPGAPNAGSPSTATPLLRRPAVVAGIASGAVLIVAGAVLAATFFIRRRARTDALYRGVDDAAASRTGDVRKSSSRLPRSALYAEAA